MPRKKIWEKKEKTNPILFPFLYFVLVYKLKQTEIPVKLWYNLHLTTIIVSKKVSLVTILSTLIEQWIPYDSILYSSQNWSHQISLWYLFIGSIVTLITCITVNKNTFS